MRLLSILVRHGTEKYPDALAHLRAFHRACLPSASCDVLVVDNGVGPVAAGPGEPETIAGSNRHWEFSGWDEGLAHLGPRVRDYDLVHLVTSAFRTMYTRYIDRCDETTLGLVKDRRAAVGHLDYYDEPIEVLGGRSQSWLRSSFVFLPPPELTALGSLVGVPDGAPFFSEDPAHPFRPDAPLSESYQRYILGWLTGGGTGQGTEWHSRFDLTEETLPLFRTKSLAILNEQMLSIRLRRQGCELVDATWLATQARRRRRWPWRRKLLAVPHWSDQLAGRDSDAVSVRRLE